MPMQLADAWDAWRSWPIDQQLLSLGAALLAMGFALLFWTPLGNRPVIRYCFALAVLGHMLLWGIVTESVAARGSRTTAARPAPTMLKELAVDLSPAPDASGGAWASLLDPRNRRSEPPSIEPPKKETPEPVAERPRQSAPVKPLELKPETGSKEPPKIAEAERSAPKSVVAAEAPVKADAPSRPEERFVPKIESARPSADETPVANVREAAPPPVRMSQPPEAKSPPKPVEAAAADNRTKTEAAPAPKSESPKQSIEPEAPKRSAADVFVANSGAARPDDVVVRPTGSPPAPPSNASTNGAAAAAAASPVATAAPEVMKASADTNSRGAAIDPAASPPPARVIAASLPKSLGPEGNIAALRAAENRDRLLQRYGGTERTERAVALALSWLAAHQDKDGRWSGENFMRRCPDGDRCDGSAIETGSDVGVTGLAVLAFLGAGHSHYEKGRYQENVRLGLNWILTEQLNDGDLMGRNRQGRVYSHAIATLALTEAYSMTGDERLQPFAKKAVDWLVRAQNRELGGWRYVPGEDSDTSVFGWCVLALHSAKRAGLEVPDDCLTNARKWLATVSRGKNNGLACYQPSHKPSLTMTAEALVCRQLFGLQRDSETASEATIYLLQSPPNLVEPNIYYWYYGTLAMFQVGGGQWERWNDSLQRVLLGNQRTDGHQKGSWDPQRPYGVDGGRVFSTATSALCLEVYYRYLPLYKDSPEPR